MIARYEHFFLNRHLDWVLSRNLASGRNGRSPMRGEVLRRLQGPNQPAYSGRMQGYLAHMKQCPHRTLQYPFAEGPMEILGGRVFLMSEVPMYVTISQNNGETDPVSVACSLASGQRPRPDSSHYDSIYWFSPGKAYNYF